MQSYCRYNVHPTRSKELYVFKRNGGSELQPKRKKLGELLVESGLLDSDKLQIALEEQKTSWKKLGDILVEMGFVSDETLVKTVAKQISVEHINLKDTYIDSEVARLIQSCKEIYGHSRHKKTVCCMWPCPTREI